MRPRTARGRPVSERPGKRRPGRGHAAEAGRPRRWRRSSGGATDPDRTGWPGLGRWWSLAVAFAAGLALAGAFPPVGFWPLAIAGPALLTLAVWRKGRLATFAAGLTCGAVFFLALLSWLVNVAWYAWITLTVVEAVIFAVLALALPPLLRLRAWPLAVAGWWVVQEGVHDRFPWGGFPWGRLAMSQAAAPTAGLGGDRRAAAADLPARAGRARASRTSRSRCGSPTGSGAATGRSRAARRLRRDRRRPRRRRRAGRQPGLASAVRAGADRRHRHRAGRRAARQEPAQPAPRDQGHGEPRGRDDRAGAQDCRGPASRPGRW